MSPGKKRSRNHSVSAADTYQRDRIERLDGRRVGWIGLERSGRTRNLGNKAGYGRHIFLQEGEGT